MSTIVVSRPPARPIFKVEEAKLDSKKNVPFQKDQLLKIIEILGTPSGMLAVLRLGSQQWLMAHCRTRLGKDQGPSGVPEHATT